MRHADSARLRCVRGVLLLLPVALLLLGPLPAQAVVCRGDCDGDSNVTVTELMKLIRIALGMDAVAPCGDGDANNDGRITVEELVLGVNNALAGCGFSTRTPAVTPPPSHTPAPPATQTPTSTDSGAVGALQGTTAIFQGVLSQLGGAYPALDPLVVLLLSAGPSGVNDLIVAGGYPGNWTKLPNGFNVDYGTGLATPNGLLTGSATGTYSGVTSGAGTVSYDYDLASDGFSQDGKVPAVTAISGHVAATAVSGGSVVDATYSGSGLQASVTGSAHIDTRVCPKYPISGGVTVTVAGATTTITFNDKCDGTFSFSAPGTKLYAFDFDLWDCWYGCCTGYYYGLVADADGRLSLDPMGSPEGGRPTLSGSVTPTSIEFSFKAGNSSSFSSYSGHFVGRPWKTTYGLVQYIGTLTTTYDGPNWIPPCSYTNVWTETDGATDNPRYTLRQTFSHY